MIVKNLRANARVSTTPLIHSGAFTGGCRGDYVSGHKIKSNPRGNWSNLMLGPNSSNSSKWLNRRDIKMASHINQSRIGEWYKSVNLARRHRPKSQSSQMARRSHSVQECYRALTPLRDWHYNSGWEKLCIQDITTRETT